MTERWTSLRREVRRSRLSLADAEGAGRGACEVEEGVELVDEVRRGVDDVVGELASQQVAQAFAVEVRIEPGVQRAALEQVVDRVAAIRRTSKRILRVPRSERFLLDRAEEVLAVAWSASLRPQKTMARSSPSWRTASAVASRVAAVVEAR